MPALLLLAVLLLPYCLLWWRKFSLPIRLLFTAMLELIVSMSLLVVGLSFNIPVLSNSGYLIEFAAILIIGINLFLALMIAISRKS